LETLLLRKLNNLQFVIFKEKYSN